MTSRLKALLATLTAGISGLFAGCVVGNGPIYYVDDPFQFFSYAASRGQPIAIMVVGEPFANARPQVEGAIAVAFDRAFKSLGNPFRIMAPAPAAVSKIVVMFNGSHPGPPRAICDDPSSVIAGPPTAKLQVRALYCGDGPYSEYSMSFPAPQSPEDPKFEEMMDQLARFTIPREANPSRRL